MVALTGLPIGYSVIVALTGLPIGYSVMVALTGLPIRYSVIVALTGLPIGYSVIVALTGLPIGYSVIVRSSNRSPYKSNRQPNKHKQISPEAYIQDAPPNIRGYKTLNTSILSIARIKQVNVLILRSAGKQ